MKKKKKEKTVKKVNNGTFHSLENKMLRIIGISVIMVVITTSAASLLFMNKLITDIAQQQAIESVNLMKTEIDRMKKSLKTSAEAIASDRNIIDAVSSKNSKKSLDKTTAYSKELEIENITVTDIKGTVLSRTHAPEKTGDNISENQAVKGAMKGTYYSGISSDDESKYALYAVAPVIDKSGVISGAVMITYRFDDSKFVDKMKSIISDEFTIFAGDERVSTTIVNNGERVVGTKLDPKVANIVINKKQEYKGKTKILGKKYVTAYSPIFSDDGDTVTGILFSGRDYRSIEGKIYINVIIVLILATISVLSSIFIGSKTLGKRLRRPLKKVVDAAKAIGDGEIDDEIMNSLSEIKTNDEIGMLARAMGSAVYSINMMTEGIEVLKNALDEHDLSVCVDSSKNKGRYKAVVDIVENLFSELAQILYEIKDMADGIENGSAHVSAASQSLSQGATEQASSTEELAATIGEISCQVNENAVNAETASSLAKETNVEVKNSSDYMAEMMTAMNDINSISNEISKIIKVIDDIAFQTNILALNAAVEAARAGIHGKGFAVVADEVRNLANKSAEAAKSTASLIESSIQAVKNGSRIAKVTDDALENVVVKINKVNDIVYEIADAAKTQGEWINQINLGVDQISAVVQTNSATAEETAAASQELSAQAQSLHEMVSEYKMKE
mgnify:FL=1